MQWQMFVQPLVGGVLIGIAVSLMLLWNGRVTGISGIINGLFSYQRGDMGWRAAFVLGLVFGGTILAVANPELFQDLSGRSLGVTAAAGLIVGFGTVMGSGCTSGHGVCGLSRMSPRSLVATITFMALGIASVYVFKSI